MSLGSSLSAARRKHGLSQEEVAEKLGVSRQTISKWETDETVPDIWQSKHLAVLYHVTLDELIEFDPEQKEIERCIAFISEEKQQKNRLKWRKRLEMPPATNNYILYIFEYHLGLYIAHNYKPDEQNQKNM